MSKGLRHLQAALSVPETGVEGDEERELIKRGKCVDDNSLQKEPVVSPQVGVIFPGSSSVEIFKKTEENMQFIFNFNLYNSFVYFNVCCQRSHGGYHSRVF